MMRLAACALLVTAACAGTAATAPTPSTTPAWTTDAAAWPRLRDALIGTWHGTTETGARVDVTYRAIAGDSALAETWGSPTRATMTLYHPDHGGLVATHYCGQGNQARLRAVATSAAALRFVQSDITDLDADEGQLVELTLEFGADGFDRIEDYRAPDGAVERTRWRFVRTDATAATPAR